MWLNLTLVVPTNHNNVGHNEDIFIISVKSAPSRLEWCWMSDSNNFLCSNVGSSFLVSGLHGENFVNTVNNNCQAYIVSYVLYHRWYIYEVKRDKLKQTVARIHIIQVRNNIDLLHEWMNAIWTYLKLGRVTH